ncbi:MAG: hypothetical protein ACKOBG_11885 [Actinomycetota bacterium]
MTALDGDAWLVLHEIRLRGLVEPDSEVARGIRAVGIDSLIEVGYVAVAARGWRCTPEGRAAHAAWARIDPESDAEHTLARLLPRFDAVNREVIATCHAWQEQPGDWQVLDRLTAVHDRAVPILDRTTRAHPRFAGYRSALTTAVARVDAGDGAWVASPRCDSYHTVWMRLHEDLLLALGRDRQV